MSRVLIGVDAGTSNLKAAAFDLNGDQVEIATIENPVETPQSGWQEQNMTTNWKKTATVISEVVEDLGDDHEILGIGITGQGDGCWLIDEDGDPVRDAILWSDGRASEIVDEWVDNGKADVIREATGTDIFPGVTLPIMQWLVENEPETLEDADTVFYCKDWLKFKLTGERTMDYSDATLPFLDIESREYSEEVQELVDYDGVDDLLPRLAPPTEIIGEVTADAAVETGLPEGTPVISGAFDIPASAIGSGAVTPGESSSIVGTTSLNQTVLTEPPEELHGRGFTLAVDEGFYLRSMASMAGTPNIDWSYENIANNREFADVEAEIEEIPVGSEGLLYHPYLSSSGERHPFLKTSARAQFIGLSPEHDQKHMMRAIYEGVALAMRDSFEHIDVESDRVMISGGGSRSAFWCQMFADCLGAPIVLPEGDELGAKGAALLTGVALDEYEDLEAAVERTVRHTDRFEPDPEKVPKYDEWYEFYHDAYQAMFDVWDDRVETLSKLEATQSTTPTAQ